MTQSWPFAPLRPLNYGAILVDPPWPFDLYSNAGNKKSPATHYRCMTIAEIVALPLGHLAAGACLCWMWTTWPHVATGTASLVMKAWGFAPKTGGAWVKRTVTGKLSMGTGYVMRSSCEPFLLGTVGEPIYSGAQRSIRNVIEARTRGHSRKPDEPYRILERMLPDAWRCELFARQRRPGWDAWGNETDKFKAEADPPAEDPALADPRPAAAQGLAPRRAKAVQPQPLGRVDRMARHEAAPGEAAEAEGMTP